MSTVAAGLGVACVAGGILFKRKLNAEYNQLVNDYDDLCKSGALEVNSKASQLL